MTRMANTSDTTNATAAARFVAIPELLVNLGEVISNRKLLRDLCLTSQAIKAACTPFLYTELWFNDSNAYILLDQLDTLIGCSSQILVWAVERSL
ncbi:hypothetical protein DL98DRAFT_523201 [Cadophora sp. DSE1049]|nr:hypothetical protein DL98DRAFT_523201 [Cadophora sp. DSE1049]